MAFTVRTTGVDELDRVQAEVKKAFDASEALTTAAGAKAQAAATAPPQQPSGVKPGVYTIAGITSITVDLYGRITNIT